MAFKRRGPVKPQRPSLEFVANNMFGGRYAKQPVFHVEVGTHVVCILLHLATFFCKHSLTNFSSTNVVLHMFFVQALVHKLLSFNIVSQTPFCNTCYQLRLTGVRAWTDAHVSVSRDRMCHHRCIFSGSSLEATALQAPLPVFLCFPSMNSSTHVVLVEQLETTLPKYSEICSRTCKNISLPFLLADQTPSVRLICLGFGFWQE